MTHPRRCTRGLLQSSILEICTEDNKVVTLRHVLHQPCRQHTACITYRATLIDIRVLWRKPMSQEQRSVTNFATSSKAPTIVPSQEGQKLGRGSVIAKRCCCLLLHCKEMLRQHQSRPLAEIRTCLYMCSRGTHTHLHLVVCVTLGSL